MNNIIEVKELKKSYGSNAVLKGINLSVKKGEIFALLGVNGAGKTTTLECIEGLRPYDSGMITVNGKIGIQLQSSTLQAYIRPMEAVKLFAKWNKTSPDSETLRALGIYDLSNKKYSDLSTGQKRRLHLALSLIGNPEIIFLDEPTAGLDVEGRVALHNHIRRLKSQGKTIILASHDMAEVEDLCDRIAVLKNGEIAFIGTVDEFTAISGKKHLIRITSESGQENYETENITQTLLNILLKYKERNIAITDIKTDKISFEKQFINVVKGEEE